jgi:hypothetical protein
MLGEMATIVARNKTDFFRVMGFLAINVERYNSVQALMSYDLCQGKFM